MYINVSECIYIYNEFTVISMFHHPVLLVVVLLQRTLATAGMHCLLMSAFGHCAIKEFHD